MQIIRVKHYWWLILLGQYEKTVINLGLVVEKINGAKNKKECIKQSKK